MINKLEDALGARCLLGLSYYNLDAQLLKQNMLAGTVSKVDKEAGITLLLLTGEEAEPSAEFIIPTNLNCWFRAPKGEFHTSRAGVKVVDPDYLVTWDIYQTKKDIGDGEQQWWEWVARTEPPVVNK